MTIPILSHDALAAPHVGRFVHELLPDLLREEDELEVRIGRSYERKGFETVDAVPGARNVAYGSSDDDYVVQVSIRIDGWNRKVSTVLENFTAEVNRERAEAELALLEEEEAKLSAKRARLTALLGDPK